MNDCISAELSSLCYTSVDNLSSTILSVGKGALLVKADIKEAYRMVPVNPDDQFFLAVEWANRIYIDKALPFGLRSAPKIFSAMPDAIQWILWHHGIPNLLHYLDDFIFATKNSFEAETYKCTLVQTWSDLGVPLELSKLEGSSTCLTFLGIEIDTIMMQAQLPSEKLIHKTCSSKLVYCSLPPGWLNQVGPSLDDFMPCKILVTTPLIM